MFKLLRFYSLTSFIIIFLTILLLTLFYRQVTSHWIEHLAKTNNHAMAQTVLNSAAPELLACLEEMPVPVRQENGSREPPEQVVARMHRMTQNNEVRRIGIYDRNGLMFFSTGAEPAVTVRDTDPDFLAALDGRAPDFKSFGDTLSHFGGTTAADNLMRTYVPIRNTSGDKVLGVLEVDTDMNHLREESDRIMFAILLGAALILTLLYAILFLVVRHARNIIAAQQNNFLERTATLEILSEDLLQEEESKKKKIAYELHEGLAQTLSAIKINVESGNVRTKASRANKQSLELIVPVLQSAIHEVRTIATELRPSSLDELGLLPTINWFCREFERRYPEIRIQQEISLQEGIIPSQLKIVIYRIIESAFRNIAKYSNTDQIRFALGAADDMIHLIIGDAPIMQAAARTAPDANPQFRFAEIKERTSLSGGAFSTTQGNSGWVTLRASWACVK